ncbi:MAG: c-type cytochrome [Verrucomicrobiota bacterium]
MNFFRKLRYLFYCGFLILSAMTSTAEQTNEPLAALVGVLNTSSDPQFQIDVLRGMSAGLQGRRAVKMPAGWEELSVKLKASPNPEVRSLSKDLSLTFGSATALAELRATLTSDTETAPARRTALESLLKARDPSLAPILQNLLSNPDLRSPALRGLAGYEDPQTAQKILDGYEAFNDSNKRDALNTLASRVTFAKPLLTAVGEQKIARKELTADLIRQLRSLNNGEVNQQLGKVWGAVRDSNDDKKKQIEHYRKIYRAGGSQPGDASRGRAVFSKTCQQCHTLFDVGGKVGPDLTGSNRSDLDYILQNMVDPNAVIPNDYRATTLETKDDRVITGIVKSQDDNAVTILTANESITVPRKEIQSLKQNELSMMPEGLLDALAEQDVRDLIYYLSRPGQVPLPAADK